MASKTDDLSWLVNLKLSRFVFDAGAATPQGTSRDGARSANVGRLYALQWTRMHKPQPLGRTRYIRSADPTSGVGGAVVDFVSYPASFVVEDRTFDRAQDRIVLFQLVSRDASPLGNGGRGKTASSPTSETVVASGTIDLQMFRDARSRAYALTLESNFFGIGKLHFTLGIVHNTRAPKTIEETAIVLFIDTVVDGFAESRESAFATGAISPRRDAGASQSAANDVAGGRLLLRDNAYFGLRVEMEDEQTRAPVRQALAGRAVFGQTIRLHPVEKVRFVLFDDKKAIGHAAVKVDKLTSTGLPKDFALPFKVGPGYDVRIHFTVQEETVLREVAPEPSFVNRDTPSVQGVPGGTVDGGSASSQSARTPTPGAANQLLPATSGQSVGSSAARASNPTPPPPPGDRPKTAVGSSSSRNVSPAPTMQQQQQQQKQRPARPPAIDTRALRRAAGESVSSSSSLGASSDSGSPLLARNSVLAGNATAAESHTGNASPIAFESTARPQSVGGGGDDGEATQAALQRRVQALETMLQEAHDRIYFQERDIEDLSGALTHQSAMVSALQQLLQLKHGGGEGGGSELGDRGGEREDISYQHLYHSSGAGKNGGSGIEEYDGDGGPRRGGERWGDSGTGPQGRNGGSRVPPPAADSSGIVSSRPPSIAATTPRTHTPVAGAGHPRPYY